MEMPQTSRFTVQDCAVEVNMPYKEGHVLTFVEALVLNRLRAASIAKRARADIEKVLSNGHDPDEQDKEIQKIVEQEAEVFQFRPRGAGLAKPKLTPLEKEARKLARAYVKRIYDKKDRSINDNREQYNEDVGRVAAHPTTIAAAKRLLAQQEKLFAALNPASE